MSDRRPIPQGRRGERGVALLASVLLLLMLASIGMASLNVVEKDQQVAGYLNRKAIALQAADAAVAKALETLDQTGTPTVPPATLGDPALYPAGQPSYRADPTTPDPIEDVGIAHLGGFGIQTGSNNSAQFQVRFWKIRVQGEAPGATVARVEVLTGSVVGN